MAPIPPPPPPPPPPVVDPPEAPQGSVTTDTPVTPPPRTREAPTPRERAPRKPPLQRRLEEFFAAPAAVYAALGHQYPAQILTARSPALAEDLYKLAQESPPVKRMLERLMEGGAWGGVVVSFASIVLPLLSYHGVVPFGDPFSGFMGGPPPPSRGPIVPPPPGPVPSSPQGVNGAGRGATDNGYSPPVGSGPPGTVTVAGSNAAHIARDA